MKLARRTTLAFGLAAALALTLTGGPVHAQATPKVSDAWARPTVAGQSGGGGFLTIVGGAAGDRLLAASADVSGTVELHTMRMDGNVMRMHPVEAIEVPAGQTVRLAPGGLHVMFIDLKAPLKEGSSFPLRLRFEKGGEVTVPMKVQMNPPAGPAAAPMAGPKQ
jgi:periplasmic copper chaperone A